MYRIEVGAFHPLEFETTEHIAQYLEDLNVGITKSIRFIEKNTQHLTIRCCVSGEHLDITADSQEEIDRLDNKLKQRNLYRP